MLTRLTETELQAGMAGVPEWRIEDNAIVRTFAFGRFADGIAFVNRVAHAADAMDHHPDIDIRYTKVRMALSTHSAGGITAADLALARQIDAAISG